MTTPPAALASKREPELHGQTVAVIGGSSGIGLETARRARAEGAGLLGWFRRPGSEHLTRATFGSLPGAGRRRR